MIQPSAAAASLKIQRSCPLTLHDFMEEIDRWLNARSQMHFKVSDLEAGNLRS
jgi:hypothetical protein